MITCKIDSAPLAAAVGKLVDLAATHRAQCRAFIKLTPRELIHDAGPVEADGDGFIVRVGPSEIFRAFLALLTERTEIGPEGLQ